MDKKIPHTIIVLLEAQPEKAADLQKMLEYLVEETRKETGYVHYILHQSTKHPNQFMFYETWIDQEAHAKHSQTQHLQLWRANRDALLAKPPLVTSWCILDP